MTAGMSTSKACGRENSPEDAGHSVASIREDWRTARALGRAGGPERVWAAATEAPPAGRKVGTTTQWRLAWSAEWDGGHEGDRSQAMQLCRTSARKGRKAM